MLITPPTIFAVLFTGNFWVDLNSLVSISNEPYIFKILREIS